MIFQHLRTSHLLFVHTSFFFKKKTNLFSSSRQAPYIPLECTMKIIRWLISQKTCLYNLWYFRCFTMPTIWSKDRKFTWMCSHCVMSQDDGWHGKKSLWKDVKTSLWKATVTVSAYDEWWSFTYTCQLKYTQFIMDSRKKVHWYSG